MGRPNEGHEHGGPECRKLLERLSEYIDGELDTAACAEVEAHTAGCGRCEEFIESLRRTVGLLHRVPRPEIPDQIKKEITEAVARLKNRKDR